MCRGGLSLWPVASHRQMMDEGAEVCFVQIHEDRVYAIALLASRLHHLAYLPVHCEFAVSALASCRNICPLAHVSSAICCPMCKWATSCDAINGLHASGCVRFEPK